MANSRNVEEPKELFSWKEGERNFWSTNATQNTKDSRNMEELKELHGEGGSDVFTSTRHVNPNATPNTKDFKMKFWSNDDAPIIRPLLKTEPSSMPRTEISMGVNSHKPDGYGGIACERVTKISGRTSKQWLAGYAVLILGAAGLSAALLKFKQTKKSLN